MVYLGTLGLAALVAGVLIFIFSGQFGVEHLSALAGWWLSVYAGGTTLLAYSAVTWRTTVLGLSGRKHRRSSLVSLGIPQIFGFLPQGLIGAHVNFANAYALPEFGHPQTHH